MENLTARVHGDESLSLAVFLLRAEFGDEPTTAESGRRTVRTVVSALLSAASASGPLAPSIGTVAGALDTKQLLGGVERVAGGIHGRGPTADRSASSGNDVRGHYILRVGRGEGGVASGRSG